MAGDALNEGLKQRLSRQGEEAIGRLAEELAANPVVSSALAGAFEARERAVAAQEAAMGALGIPSAADIERLTRRVRSVSQRLEGIEDALDRLDDRLARLDGLGDRIEAAAGASDSGGSAESMVERRLEELRADVSALREAVAPGSGAVPRAQERLAVAQAEAPAPARRSAGGRGSSARSKSGSRGSGGRAAASPRRAASSARSGGSTSPGSGSGR